GGIVNRLTSQEDLLKGQITNYKAAISRIEDADVAKEQLELIKSQFLQQASLVSLTQANANPQAFLQLIQS
ncbi:MAG: flagellin, partial [Bacteroidota bacterium]